jgi:methylsterol monooxygenase
MAFNASAVLTQYVYDNLDAIRLPISSVVAGPDAGLFERAWRYVDNNFTKFEVATVGSFSFHLVVYLLLCLPNIILLVTPLSKYFARYKIQKTKQLPTWSELWKVLKYALFNQIFVEAPGYLFLKLYTDYNNIPYNYDTIPAWYKLVPKIIAAYMLEDAWHYCFHRVLHMRALYPYVHKKHHEYPVPFSLTAEYAHPVETILLGTGFFIGVFLMCDHVAFLHLWVTMRLLETIDVHSGYSFPWNPLHLIPFYGGAKAHDAHHKKFNGNYSSTFTYLDHIFGTAIADAEIDEVDTKTL